MSVASLDAARRVKNMARDVVAQSAVVTGVGIARLGDSYAVKVNLRDSVFAGLPEQIDGVPLIYEQTGAVKAR